MSDLLSRAREERKGMQPPDCYLSTFMVDWLTGVSHWIYERGRNPAGFLPDGDGAWPRFEDMKANVERSLLCFAETHNENPDLIEPSLPMVAHLQGMALEMAVPDKDTSYARVYVAIEFNRHHGLFSGVHYEAAMILASLACGESTGEGNVTWSPHSESIDRLHQTMVRWHPDYGKGHLLSADTCWLLRHNWRN